MQLQMTWRKCWKRVWAFSSRTRCRCWSTWTTNPSCAWSEQTPERYCVLWCEAQSANEDNIFYENTIPRTLKWSEEWTASCPCHGWVEMGPIQPEVYNQVMFGCNMNKFDKNCLTETWLVPSTHLLFSC